MQLNPKEKSNYLFGCKCRERERKKRHRVNVSNEIKVTIILNIDMGTTTYMNERRKKYLFVWKNTSNLIECIQGIYLFVIEYGGIDWKIKVVRLILFNPHKLMLFQINSVTTSTFFLDLSTIQFLLNDFISCHFNSTPLVNWIFLHGISWEWSVTDLWPYNALK